MNLLIGFVKLVESFGQNKVFVGLSTIAGILGTIISIFLLIRTKKISKVLQLNKAVVEYNELRTAFQRSFEGYRFIITSDEEKNNSLIKGILRDVEAYRVKFAPVIKISEKCELYLLVLQLKKDSTKVDYNKVANYLAKLYGRLEKEEENFNG